MSAWKIESLSSVKSTVPRSVYPIARTRKAAIWPRVTGASGQNWSLSGGLQPLVIPASASHANS